jgi:hypothetical protein
LALFLSMIFFGGLKYGRLRVRDEPFRNAALMIRPEFRVNRSELLGSARVRFRRGGSEENFSHAYFE